MNNKEAIEWLRSIDKKYIHGGDEQYDEQRHEAIKTAIEALEKGDRYNEGYLAGQACAKWRSGV